MNLAMLEMAVMISTLCQHFIIEPGAANLPVSEVFGLTMKPEGVRVRLRRPRACTNDGLKSKTGQS